MFAYYCYRVLVYLLLPFMLLLQWRKGFRNRGYWSHWGDRLGFVNVPQKNYDYWVHAVSVGEVRAAAPLIKRMLSDNPERKILLTVSTPTGRDTVDLLLKDSVDVCYMPYDVGFATRLFLQRTQPKVAVILETEVWPNLIVKAQKMDIPLLYINVRLSERSFKRYQSMASFSRMVFSRIDYFAIQSASDAARVHQLGVPLEKFSITGNIKFDVQMPASLAESAQGLRGLLTQQRTVWIAGSTREGEEELLLQIYQNLKTDHPDLLLVIVPRHPERFDSVAKLCQKHSLQCVRRTENPMAIEAEVDVYLGDTMGELSLMYAAADIAFVGGSLVPFGGQNILEPCALGIPVLFGPHMFNFEEISALTIEAGAGIQVLDPQGLQKQLQELIQRPNKRDEMGSKGKALIEEHKGALERIYQLVVDLD
ncbi:MAG: lipid IV(A) 3-deoxy-D-manno-octulosonic acid transferase [Arenicella sp.]